MLIGALALPIQASQNWPPLDTATVHRLYLEGEFDDAIRLTEKALKDNRVPTHADSIFAFKHLGVMYSAEYKTRESGKRYMYQLLSIEPTAKIMDMYASDMIYMIFKNVQEEVEHNRANTASPKHSLAGKDSVSPGIDTIPKPSRRRTWPFWTAGALAVVGAGVTTYFLVEGGGSTPATNHAADDK